MECFLTKTQNALTPYGLRLGPKIVALRSSTELSKVAESGLLVGSDATNVGIALLGLLPNPPLLWLMGLGPSKPLNMAKSSGEPANAGIIRTGDASGDWNEEERGELNKFDAREDGDAIAAEVL